MAAGEDQAQQVVGDATLTGFVVPLTERRQFRRLPQFRGLNSRPPQPVEGPVAGRGGEPRAGAVRDAVARPALKRAGEGVLHALLGQVPVPRHPDQGRHDAAPLLPVDGGDLGVGRHDQSSANGLTSTAPNRATGCRDAIWIASSRSAHSITSYPAMYSLVSANGPPGRSTSSPRVRPVVAPRTGRKAEPSSRFPSTSASHCSMVGSPATGFIALSAQMRSMYFTVFSRPSMHVLRCMSPLRRTATGHDGQPSYGKSSPLLVTLLTSSRGTRARPVPTRTSGRSRGRSGRPARRR